MPESFDEHFKIMFDLQVLAFRAQITRVATMMFARDTSGAVYPQSGVREGFHVASHHANNRANMDRFALINRYHVQMLAYFLDKLKATPDGDGNLLDHSMVLYGSSMSNGNQHDHDPLPVVLAGGASGQLKGGRHMQYAPHTPMSNLLLTYAGQARHPGGSPRRQHWQAGNLVDHDLVNDRQENHRHDEPTYISWRARRGLHSAAPILGTGARSFSSTLLDYRDDFRQSSGHRQHWH